MSDTKNKNLMSGLGSVIVLCLGAWYFFGGGMEKEAAKNLSDIEDQVAHDAEAQYQIAKRSGTPMDACLHAGLVAAAYIQAKNEQQYQSWKGREKEDCETAGVPR